MSVDETEPLSSLEPTVFGQMHAPMKILISGIVSYTARCATYNDRYPMREKEITCQKRKRPDKDERRPIPPFHGYGFPILFNLEVIGMISFERTVMHDGMGMKRIFPSRKRSMHDILV